MNYFTDWLNKYKITSTFGQRNLFGRTFHSGQDYSMPTGTPVFSVGDGKVTSVTKTAIGGNQVSIQLDSGEVVSFLHLSKTNVQKGQRVSAGQEVALSGNTGQSTGSHLDFRVRKDGEYINPNDWLKGITSNNDIIEGEGGSFLPSLPDFKTPIIKTGIIVSLVLIGIFAGYITFKPSINEENVKKLIKG